LTISMGRTDKGQNGKIHKSVTRSDGCLLSGYSRANLGQPKLMLDVWAWLCLTEYIQTNEVTR